MAPDIPLPRSTLAPWPPHPSPRHSNTTIDITRTIAQLLLHVLKHSVSPLPLILLGGTFSLLDGTEDFPGCCDRNWNFFQVGSAPSLVICSPFSVRTLTCPVVRKPFCNDCRFRGQGYYSHSHNRWHALFYHILEPCPRRESENNGICSRIPICLRKYAFILSSVSSILQDWPVANEVVSFWRPAFPFLFTTDKWSHGIIVNTFEFWGFEITELKSSTGKRKGTSK